MLGKVRLCNLTFPTELDALVRGDYDFNRILKGEIARFCAIIQRLHIIVQKKKMERYLKRLSELILMEMEKGNLSGICFADLCGISRNELNYIINGKKSDIRLSTIVKICENSNIRIEHIFCDCKTEKIMNNAIVLINGNKFKMEIKEYAEKSIIRNTPRK